MRVPPKAIQNGLAHLRAVDPVLCRLMDRTQPFQLRLEPDRFRALVRSIVSQQISGQAAESIFRRLLALFDPETLSAEKLAQTGLEKLRAAGISPQKAGYLLDLAERVRTSQLRLEAMARLSDEAVIEQLVQVKGIGVWTAQMFLIFSLGRLNVFPAQDLGVRVALRNLYGLKTMPDRNTSERIAAPWQPFATLASWYCWRSLELPADKF
jgi:DNA-3-methyladenine glycosylase II